MIYPMIKFNSPEEATAIYNALYDLGFRRGSNDRNDGLDDLLRGAKLRDRDIIYLDGGYIWLIKPDELNGHTHLTLTNSLPHFLSYIARNKLAPAAKPDNTCPF